MAQSRRKGRSGAALLVSVAVHGVLLLLLARAVPILPSVGREEPFQIDLVTAPTVQTRAPRPETTPAATPVSPPRERTSHQFPLPGKGANPPQSNRQSPLRPAPPHPSPSIARVAPAVPSRPAVSPGAGQTPQMSASQGQAANTRRPPASLPGDEPAGGVKQFLRETVGCSHQDFLHLTIAERAECERQNGVQASIGGRQHLDAIPAGKRGYYNDVQQAYQSLHHYETPLDTGAGGQGASAPGHGPSFGCIHGKCGVISPEGVLTEESGTDPH